MRAQFFYGTLCHPELQEVVLGRRPASRPARLADHAVRWAEGESFPMILPEPGAVAEGVIVTGLTPEEAARLDFYEGGFGYSVEAVTVAHDGTTEPALVYRPEAGLWRPGALWRLEEWQARWAPVVIEAARDFMAAYGRRSAAEVLARYPMMLTRAGARLRARRPGPASLRRRCAPEDLDLAAWREPYAAYFAVEETDLRFRRFDGAMSPPVTRAAFVMGDAVTVLPYDPTRDRVLVVEQFRAGTFARGDANPWSIEPIAGRIDGAESPEEAARRETREEARLGLAELLPVAGYYPSPAAVTEYIFSFVALADLPDSAAGLGGEASETEDIRSHVIAFDRLMALIETGEVANAPLILTALWLSRHRESLRARA